MIDRNLARVRTCSVVAAFLAGIALISVIYAWPRVAATAIILVVFLQIWSVEVLRNLLARNRGIIP